MTPHNLFGRPGKLPVVIAHRGAGSLAPENTLEACRQAASIGVELIELDFRLSRDKQLVAIHDATLDRTTNGIGLVSQKSLDELKQLDAGYHFSRDQGLTQPYRQKGVGLSTLDQFLAEFPRQKFMIELKDSSDEAILSLSRVVRKHDAYERIIVVIININHKTGKRLRQIDPKLNAGHTAREVSVFLALSRMRLSRFFKARGGTFEVPMRKFRITLPTRSFVKAAHAKGISVLVWTVNDPTPMRALIELGVDGIITDEPQLLKTLIADRSNQRL